MDKKKIAIIRMAMNVDCVCVFALIIKLTYAFYEKTEPRLEVFLDNEKARTNEWECYGANSNNNTNQAIELQFDYLDEEKEFSFRTCYLE